MKLLMCSAMIGAALFAAAPLAHANEDPNANPPNCSAADLEFARAGVQQATADYLVGHPDVNNFYNSLEGLTRDAARPKVAAYMKSHPQAKADLTGIRAPLADIKTRCGNPGPPPP
jgi:hemophore-related protein